MKLRIPKTTIDRWASDLKAAGHREFGGVLFGEQIAEGDFRIVEATHQRFWGGTPTTFNRRGGTARKEILRLHEKTGGNPERFNYLGEWHSHPNAPTVPSLQDEITMYELLADQAGAVNFLILILVRLEVDARVCVGAQTFLGSGHRLNCGTEIEGAEHNAMDAASVEEEEEK